MEEKYCQDMEMRFQMTASDTVNIHILVKWYSLYSYFIQSILFHFIAFCSGSLFLVLQQSMFSLLNYSLSLAFPFFNPFSFSFLRIFSPFLLFFISFLFLILLFSFHLPTVSEIVFILSLTALLGT